MDDIALDVAVVLTPYADLPTRHEKEEDRKKREQKEVGIAVFPLEFWALLLCVALVRCGVC